MLDPIRRYAHWLHTRWPSGQVENIPVVREDGSTNVPGLYVAGDLTGIPLLKLAADSGARVVQALLCDDSWRKSPAPPGALDLVIVGGGVSGMAAALEAQRAGLRFEILEASEPFSTLVNFPKAKPIYTYPTGMVPAGALQFTERSSVKEGLVEEMRAQTLERGIRPRASRAERVLRRGNTLEVVLAGEESLCARRVLVAIGRSGNFRRLGVPGEDLDKVYNRLHDPHDFGGKNVLVVGGGDSAVETAIAIAACGGRVTLSYRKGELSRPKPANLERLGESTVQLRLGTHVREIRPREVVLAAAAGHDETTLPNDAVFTLIGREAPLDFFRKSGVQIRGEWRPGAWVGFGAFLLFCVFLYHWKGSFGIPVKQWFHDRGWFPFGIGSPRDPSSLVGTLRISLREPSFYYSLAYSVCVVAFGIRRVRRRRTPYVVLQTWTLAAIQCVPLFLLPYVLLPWMGHNGWFDAGPLGAFADQFFPKSQWSEQGREYWRAVGFVLAWPLMFWNVFTSQPLWGWLAVSFVQTFVLIPLLVWRWGKGAYCGWICSCGALAETLGDAHRQKMPHGPRWNRLNMTGQAILAGAFLLLLLRIAGWILPGNHALSGIYSWLFVGQRADGSPLPFPLNLLGYAWFVDLFLAGILGLGLYFWFSGRMWCRFACPLAALMHVYARFSRFRIFADKKKCISCNVCTSVCHQGIDVMSFANKGQPMEDPECVRCSACVQSCPTGVLTFGQIDRRTGSIAGLDRLQASPVQMAELRSQPSKPHGA